mgnify:FL=1
MANPIRSIFSALHMLIRKVLGLPKKKKAATPLVVESNFTHKKKKCSKSTLEKIMRRKWKKKKKDHDEDHDKDHDDKD